MNSKTDICNLAISHLGSGVEISDFETDLSEEAKACRVYYDMCRDIVLRDFWWPFARKIVTLGLVDEDPDNEWGYSYRYPSDALMIRRLQSGTRNDTRQSEIVFNVASDDDGSLVLTDAREAIAEYTFRNENVSRYPADFVEALSYRLAAFISPRICGGMAANKKTEMMQLYSLATGKASANAANEMKADEQPESEFIRAREDY